MQCRHQQSILPPFPLPCFITPPLFQLWSNLQKLQLKLPPSPPPPPLWLPETTFCFYASLKVSFTAALPPAIKYLYEKPHGFAAAGWCSAGNLGEPDLNSNEIAGTHEIPGLFPPILQPAAVLPGASPASHPHPHSPGAQQVLSVLTSRALWGEKAG